jgi:hypothetical protein
MGFLLINHFVQPLGCPRFAAATRDHAVSECFGRNLEYSSANTPDGQPFTRGVYRHDGDVAESFANGCHGCTSLAKISNARPSGPLGRSRLSRINALRITSSGTPNCRAMLQTTALSLAAVSESEPLLLFDKKISANCPVANREYEQRYFRPFTSSSKFSLGRRLGRRMRDIVNPRLRFVLRRATSLVLVRDLAPEICGAALPPKECGSLLFG